MSEERLRKSIPVRVGSRVECEAEVGMTDGRQIKSSGC